MSGDEFAIAIPCADMTETVAQLSERIALAFNAPLLTGTRQHRVKVSIGVGIYPGGGRTADELLGNSHLAFCRAKATRRGSYVIFESAIRQELEARLTLEAELALAAERNEFELFYQPQVRLTDGGLIGAEALIRWRHPVRGLVSPAEFMPVVNTSISDRIAGWVLETACRQARIWRRADACKRWFSPQSFRNRRGVDRYSAGWWRDIGQAAADKAVHCDARHIVVPPASADAQFRCRIAFNIVTARLVDGAFFENGCDQETAARSAFRSAPMRL